MSASPGSAPRDRRAGTTLAMLLVACGCSGGERASASSERPGEPSPPAPATGAPSSAGEPAAPPTAPSVPPTSIDLVDAAPLELDWPVVPASDAHDAVLPPGVLPDDFAIIVRPRIGAAPFVELRPRAGMSGRWELVAADAEVPEDPSTDLSESLVWSVEVPVRRVAGLYAFVLAHETDPGCTEAAGLPARYARRSVRVACGAGEGALALRARLDQLVAELAPL